MVLRREAIEQRLKELDEILQELNRYREIDPEAFRNNVSQRWIVERGLIAAASIVFDVADHILAGELGLTLANLIGTQIHTGFARRFPIKLSV